MGSLDATGVQSTSDVNNDKNLPLAGTYMVAVNDVKYHEKDGEETEIFETQVLGGTTPGQDGTEVTIFLKHNEDGGYSKKHVRFALAAQLMAPGQKVDVDFGFFEQARGRCLIVRMEDFTNKQGKPGVSIGSFGFDMWAPNDPDVAEMVRKMDGKVPAMLQQLYGQQGGGQVANGQVANGQQQQVAQQPQQPAPAQQPVQQQAPAPSAPTAPPIQTPANMAVAAAPAAAGDGWDV